LTQIKSTLTPNSHRPRRVGPSRVTSHRQPRQCRGGQGPKTVKGAQSDPNYVSLSTIKTVIRLCSGISQNHNPCARARSESLPGAQKLQLRHWSGQVGRCQPGDISVFSAFSAIEPRCCRYRGESPITASALLVSSFKHCGPPCIHTAGGPRLSLYRGPAGAV